MKRRFFDHVLGVMAALASKNKLRMDGTPDDKSGKEALTGFISDLKGLLSTAKDGASAVATFNDSLIKDNYNLRESRRQLKTELENAKKLPDGSRIIAGDDAKEFDAFRKLGVKPEQVSTILVDYDNLRVGQQSRDAADALGWKPSVLKKLIETMGLEVTLKEETVEEDVNGKKEKVKKQVPYVFDEEDDKEVKLVEYEPLKEFHLSLVKEEAEGSGAGGRTTQTGVRMPPQSSVANGRNGKKGGEMSTIVSNTLESRYRRPEPANGKGQTAGSKK